MHAVGHFSPSRRIFPLADLQSPGCRYSCYSLTFEMDGREKTKEGWTDQSG